MTEAERTITTPDTPGRAPDPEAQAGPGATGAADSGAASEVPAATAGPDAGDADDATAATDVPRVPDADDTTGMTDASAVAGAAARGGRRIAVLTAVAAFAYVLDQLSKLWVVHSLEHHQPVDVFGHYLRLEATRNGGAAFGLGQGMTIVFTVIAAGVIAVIVRLSRKLYSAPWAVALGLLLGGALGNLTDRVLRSPGGFQGWVVDFVHPEHFAIFNLADSAICCGGALIVLLSFRGVEPDGTRRED